MKKRDIESGGWVVLRFLEDTFLSDDGSRYTACVTKAKVFKTKDGADNHCESNKERAVPFYAMLPDFSGKY